MRFKRLILSASIIGLCAHLSAHAVDFGGLLKNGKPKGQDAAAAPAALDASSVLRSEPIDSKSKDLPDWLKDSKRLQDMLGADANYRVENPKVIRRVEAPFPGLEGYVVEATSFSDATPEGKKELYVFYTDKSKRYLMVGMMIDMQKNRDVNVDTERFVRGELADNPAKALRPQDMHAIVVPGGAGSAVSFVVDLGKQAGRDSLLNLVRFHQALRREGAAVRPLRLVLVSAGHDEFATAAMAIAYGAETISGTGLAKAMEFAEKARDVAWLQPKSMGKDSEVKRILGTGVFKMEDNSTQALLARLDTLPLVYDGEKERMVNVPLPASQADWKRLLTKK
jgi:hypothetical protein|nr:hypothetical protein [uncultured Comamonas sp.]